MKAVTPIRRYLSIGGVGSVLIVTALVTVLIFASPATAAPPPSGAVTTESVVFLLGSTHKARPWWPPCWMWRPA